MNNPENRQKAKKNKITDIKWWFVKALETPDNKTSQKGVTFAIVAMRVHFAPKIRHF